MSHVPALARHRLFAGWLTAAAWLAVGLTAFGDDAEPLHRRIDAEVDTAAGGVTAPVVDDGQFLRRLSLDLTGTIPSVEDAQSFLADSRPEKRAAAVDRLIASPRFAHHLANVLHVMLLERRPEKHVKEAEWRQYLFESLQANKPLNQLCREILAADGTDERIRPAAAFYLVRDGEPNVITRDVGRMFFGMDLQCCQCHDHPLIDSYKQADYFGLYAFVSRSSLFTDKDKQVFYAEQAEGDVSFTSVFTQQQDQTRPRLPGDVELNEPVFVHGDEYAVAPAENVRPVPKHSRRLQLAERATSGSNRAFNRALANRLWAHLMGRGLAHPVDYVHDEAPPHHAQLLDLLADDLAAHQFDLRYFLRELALTEVYQRGSTLPAELAQRAATAEAQLATAAPELTAAEQRLAAATATVVALQTEVDTADAAAEKVRVELAAANKAVDEAAKKSAAAEKKLADATAAWQPKADISAALAEAAAKARAAAAKLADDAALAGAAALFEARLKSIGDEAAALRKSVDDLTPPAQQAVAARNAAKQAAAAIVPRVEAAQQGVAGIQEKLAAALHGEQTAKRDVFQGQTTVAELRTLVALQHSETAATQARQQLDATRRSIAQGREQRMAAEAALPQLTTAHDAARQQHEQAAATVAAAQQQLVVKQEAMQLTAVAAAQAQLAAEKLANDAELKQAAATVKQRHEQLAADISASEKSVNELKQAAQTMAAAYAATGKALADQQALVKDLADRLAAWDAALPGLDAAWTAKDAEAASARRRLDDLYGERFFRGSPRALSPEQIGWSIMEATGVVKQQAPGIAAELDQKLPLDANHPDPARVAERERLGTQLLFDKLGGQLGTFVSLFGHGPGQPQVDFFATVDQALFFANGGALQGWLNPGGNNLTERLNLLTDAAQLADELYLAILTRRPNAEETADVTAYLVNRTEANDRIAAVKELAWALLTSVEFRFRG